MQKMPGSVYQPEAEEIRDEDEAEWAAEENFAGHVLDARGDIFWIDALVKEVWGTAKRNGARFLKISRSWSPRASGEMCMGEGKGAVDRATDRGGFEWLTRGQEGAVHESGNEQQQDQVYEPGR